MVFLYGCTFVFYIKTNKIAVLIPGHYWAGNYQFFRPKFFTYDAVFFRFVLVVIQIIKKFYFRTTTTVTPFFTIKDSFLDLKMLILIITLS